MMMATDAQWPFTYSLNFGGQLLMRVDSHEADLLAVDRMYIVTWGDLPLKVSIIYP